MCHSRYGLSIRNSRFRVFIYYQLYQLGAGGHSYTEGKACTRCLPEAKKPKVLALTRWSTRDMRYIRMCTRYQHRKITILTFITVDSSGHNDVKGIIVKGDFYRRL